MAKGKKIWVRATKEDIELIYDEARGARLSTEEITQIVFEWGMFLLRNPQHHNVIREYNEQEIAKNE